MEDVIYKYQIRYFKESFRDILSKTKFLLKEIGKLTIELNSKNLIFNFELVGELKADVRCFNNEVLNIIKLLDKINLENSAEIKNIIYKYQEKYRYALNKLSCFITGIDWQSISYESSHRPNILFSKELGYRGVLGYKRINYPILEIYEKIFFRSFIKAIQKDNLFCAFTSSGQGAYSIAESLILKFYLNKGDNIAYIKDAYYETRFCIDLMKGFKVTAIKDISVEIIAKKIIEKNIRFLTIEPIYNSRFIKILDIPKLLEILNKHNFRQDIYLVIDNSMLGGCFHPFNLRLNPKINIILIESLIKYRQMGLDRVNAGVMILENKHKGKVIALRGALGCILQDGDLLKLPLMKQSFFNFRMKLLSANAFYVSKKLQYFLKFSKLKVIDISYPMLKNYKNLEGKKVYPYFGSVFTLMAGNGFFIDKAAYLKFVSKVIKIAKSKNVSINHGTSFGFESTRIALADMDGGTFKNPYIRFSIGCENKNELDDLIKVIQCAILESFSKNITNFKIT